MIIAGTKNTVIGDRLDFLLMSDYCYLLDTDDCVVECYLASDCFKLKDTLGIEGIMSTNNLVYVDKKGFDSALNGGIEVAEKYISVGGVQRFSITRYRRCLRVQGVGGVEFFSINFNMAIKKETHYFIWAERLSKFGVRFILEVICSVADDMHIFHVYLLLDNEGQLLVEKIEVISRCKNLDFHIGETYLIKGALAGKLAILGVF